ncbi:MAG: maleylpyruvate isomerase N-terminal domain-containing protein [Acidobacteriota bacterium]
MKALAPIDTRDLLAPLHAELIELLRGLSKEAWNRPTVAGDWRVRDVAAHLLDGQLRTVSSFRDAHLPPPDRPIDSYEDLVGFLDHLNASWVAVARRLSERVITDLLAWVGPEAAAALASLPLHEPALFSVAWAGEGKSTNWMHVGREFTEWWHHQAQIREAVGAPPFFDPRWFQPLLDVSMRVLPTAYRSVQAETGATLAVEVDGSGVGWALVRSAGRWELFEGSPQRFDARIDLDPETAWKTLYHALDPQTARSRARVVGDESLAAPFFAARSVMVATVAAPRNLDRRPR